MRWLEVNVLGTIAALGILLGWAISRNPREVRPDEYVD